MWIKRNALKDNLVRPTKRRQVILNLKHKMVLRRNGRTTLILTKAMTTPLCSDPTKILLLFAKEISACMKTNKKNFRV
jgi:hypothetical protein